MIELLCECLSCLELADCSMYAIIACRVADLYRIIIVHQPLIPTAVKYSDVVIAVLIQYEERRACSPASSAVECEEVVECEVAVSPDFLESFEILDCSVRVGEVSYVSSRLSTLAPYSAFRLTGFVHVAISAGLAEPLILRTDADELEVVIIGKSVLSVFDGYPVFRVCRYISSEICGSFRSSCCLFVEFVSCCCPCFLAAVEDLDIFNTTPDVSISLTCCSADIIAVQYDLGILGDAVSEQIVSDCVSCEEVVSTLFTAGSILYFLDGYIGCTRKVSFIVAIAWICRISDLC